MRRSFSSSSSSNKKIEHTLRLFSLHTCAMHTYVARRIPPCIFSSSFFSPLLLRISSLVWYCGTNVAAMDSGGTVEQVARTWWVEQWWNSAHSGGTVVQQCAQWA